MDGNNTIVATYDYYTLDQARKIIYAEMAEDRERKKEKSRRRRKEKLESIKLTIGLFISLIGIPMLMVLHWIVTG